MVPSISIAFLVLVFVVLMRRRLTSVYAAKGRKHESYGAHCARAASPVTWVTELYRTRDIDLLRSQIVDGYLLLRYLKLCILLCLGGCVILCPLLIPLNATGHGGMSQLDALTIANVKKGSLKTYAHSCCTILYFGWVMFVVRREKMFYLDLMHERLAMKRRIGHPDSRTVLFTNAVGDIGNLDAVNQVFGDMRGMQVWFATDVRSLAKRLRQRTALVDKIDTILTKLPPEYLDRLEDSFGKSTADSTPLEYQMETVKKCAVKIKNLKVNAEQKLHEARCRGVHMNKSIDENPLGPHSPRLLSSIFIRFDSVENAEIAHRSRFHKDLTRFIPRLMDTPPRDICWENLRLGWWQSLVKRTLSQVIILGMIIFWSVPVAVAAALTNVENIVPDNLWSKRIPPSVRNASSGLLPSLVLSMLMSLAPKIMARLAKFAGVLTLGDVEIYVQKYYFCFRVVQVFLVTALGSTAISVLAQVYSSPESATTVLAKRLPGASNFYLSYFVVQGFTEAALVMLNIDGLLSRYMISGIFDDTPRKKARRRKECFHVNSGTVLAICSSLLVIALCYAPTAPLILCFATTAFTMFYLSYRHNLFLVADVAAETSGKMYYRALQHTMVGIYIGELYLIGLFMIASVDGRRFSGLLILSCALLVGTFVFQQSSHHSLKRWHNSPPWSSAGCDYEMAEVKGIRFPMSLHYRMCAVFLDDLKAICEVLMASDGAVRSWRQEECEFLAPVIVEKEANILLPQGIDSFTQAMLGMELQGAFTVGKGSDL